MSNFTYKSRMGRYVTGGLVLSLLLAVATAIYVAAERPAAGPLVTVYKNPACQCCTAWVSHIERAGFDVDVRNTPDLDVIRAQLEIEPTYSACHTAMIDGYVIEGHVPARDIKRLLAEKPPAKGIAVPGMPIGSPGMEGPNAEPYDVLIIAHDGTIRTYAHHGPNDPE